MQKNDLVKINSKILDLKVVKRGTSGRVIQLEISHNNPMSNITWVLSAKAMSAGFGKLNLEITFYPKRKYFKLNVCSAFLS